MAKVLLTYQNKHKIDTVGKIISRYAPDENVASYSAFVARRLGVGVNSKISIMDNLEGLVRAMIDFENGSGSARAKYYNPFISEGVNRAK